jgi:hypothetical protein
MDISFITDSIPNDIYEIEFNLTGIFLFKFSQGNIKIECSDNLAISTPFPMANKIKMDHFPTGKIAT